MSFKVAFIGAGSVGFTRRLVQDLLGVPEFHDIEIAFMDIDAHNLDMVYQLIRRDVLSNGLKKVKLVKTLNRRAAVKDARYVFNVTRIGGLPAFQTDIDIPLKYGIDQCVGDTLCAGGIMYGQRGIPAVLDFCWDIGELAEPNCLFMNYGNPNAMLTWAANHYGKIRTLGLCHGVQGGHHLLANALGIPPAELDYICAGINHQTWYIQLRHKGQDMTGKILEALEKHPTYGRTEKVRIDMLRRFGCFSTESNGHLSEYLPWYRKRLDEIKDWIDLGSWINGETGGYLRVCTEGRNWFDQEFPNWMKAPPQKYGPEHRGHEHGAFIIEGLETGRIYRGHFNVVNHRCITNLPQDAIVEVPGYVDRNGINIPRVGDLPLGCAAVCNASISVQRMAVIAAVTGDDTLLRQAMMMDPLTGAVCNPPEIWQMVDELLVAQAKWLPQYRQAIAVAKKRLGAGKLIPTREGFKGTARLHTRTVAEMARDRKQANEQAGEADKAKKRPAAK
ncbi:MAG: alpha-glucosidase/alpha-galactosidase [Lentisphaerae bacterium RIFOXYA12_64_32]|nr:MAG: alpha-glucosidase/alpha-galactosidase [Lentisphaerae bacterium RIFOXYA12_64_32]